MMHHDYISRYDLEPEPFMAMLEDQDYEDWLTDIDERRDHDSRRYDHLLFFAPESRQGDMGASASTELWRSVAAPTCIGARPIVSTPRDGRGLNDSTTRRSTCSPTESDAPDA